MSIVLLALHLLCQIGCSAPPAIDPEAIEPPLGYSLQIAEKTVRLRAGESIKLEGTFHNPEVKLVADEYRTFSGAGISFRYPATYGFQADLDDENVRLWTLDGNDVVILVQAFKGKLSSSNIMDNLIASYGKENCQVTEATITLAGQMRKGQRLQAKVATTTVVQEVFSLPAASGSLLMILQDSPNDDGTQSNDRKIVGKLLTESFAITKPKSR